MSVQDVGLEAEALEPWSLGAALACTLGSARGGSREAGEEQTQGASGKRRKEPGAGGTASRRGEAAGEGEVRDESPRAGLQQSPGLLQLEQADARAQAGTGFSGHMVSGSQQDSFCRLRVW